MTDVLIFMLCFAAALGCGLMAGFFFAFSTAVMGGLARRPAAEAMAAMQSINLVVLNPVFRTAFFGTAAVCVGVTLSSLMRWAEAGAASLLVGSGLYRVGSVVVTMAFNVPLNQGLAKVAPAGPDCGERWSAYLTRWMMWNHVRTAAALAAATLITVGLCQAPTATAP